MNIVLWRTTKRDNSTATPDSQPAWFTNRVTYDVKLKEDTTVLNPSFLLNVGGHDGQNYLQAFGRYYWITDITTLGNDLWMISCKIDPLGSYRGHIRNTTAYVLYDSTANSEIPDNRLGVYTTPTMAQSTTEMPWGFSSGTGTKFLAIEGDGELVDEGKADGATGVYSVHDADITDIGNGLDLDDFFSNITASYSTVDLIWKYKNQNTWNALTSYMDSVPVSDFVTGIVGGFALFVNMIYLSWVAIIQTIKGLITGGDALKHVKSAYWLPFNCYDEGSAKSRVAIGSFVNTMPSAKLITSPFKTTVVNVGIPWQFSDWRNVQNTEIQLFIPLIGNINIPTSAVKGHSNISVRMNLNMYSGTLSVRVQCGDATLGSYGSNVGMPILIGDSNANVPAITNTVASVAGTVAGVATGNVALTAGAITSGIQSGLNCIQPISTSVGGIGGGAGNQLGILIVCTTICHNTSDAPADLLPIIGTPTNVLKQLNGSGYCQTMQAHLSMSAVTGESYPTESEVQQVNSALNSGVFLE